MGKLTSLSVGKAMKMPGRHQDGDGLCLDVGAGGRASWTLRVQHEGKRRDFGLGSAKSLPLADARTKAANYRAMVKAGLDPKTEKQRAAAIPTFEEAARLVHAARVATWRNGKHQQQWLRTLELYAFKRIGAIKINAVSKADIHDVLAAIWTTVPETARRVSQRIAVVLNWASSKGYRENEAPMRSVHMGLPNNNRSVRHQPALPYSDLPAFVAGLASKTSWSRLALRACILTATRSGEVRKATWDQVDFVKRLWTIPPQNMKTGKAHVVPLSAAAMEVFEEAKALRSVGSNYVFRGLNPKAPMSDMTMTKLLRDAGEPVTVHGFRSTFRDWAAERTDFAGEVVEQALAHTVANRVEAAYRRTNYLEKRTVLMEQWGVFATSQQSNVVPFAKAS